MKSLAIELEEIKDIAKTEDYIEALRLVDDLILHNSHEDKIWATRAFINSRKGDREAAIVDWSKAIGLCEEPHYFYMRGHDLFNVGRYREAISDFTKVIALCDMYKSDYYRGPAYFFRADAHVRLREFDEARLDCAYVRDDMQTWTDKLRTRADILAECNQH
jgi:tetratricopeptide (TPR) repeat protein